MLPSTWLRDIVFLILITSLSFGLFLGSRNLSAPDELRYSEIPREMIVNHNYIIPTINGVKYFEKPPLFYWMQVASIKSFGLNEWGLRFANAFMAILGVLATYLFARKIYNRKTGLISALVLSSMSLYFSMAHIITLDMTVSVFISLSLYAFFIAIKYKKAPMMLIGFIAAAAGMMTKGLIALIFPGFIFFLWLSLCSYWRHLSWRFIFIGSLLFIALSAPWHLLAQLKAPEFFHFYFVEQQFLRYTTSIAHRYQPFYFYIPILLLGTLPWIFFLPKSLAFIKPLFKKNQAYSTLFKENDKEYFFLIWFIFVFLFFSFSNSKLIPYVLPAFPAMAILIARYLEKKIIDQKKYYTKLCVSLYLISNILLISALTCVDYFDNHTVKNLIIKIQPLLSSQDEVVAYHGYYQDLPFYLKHTVTVNEFFDELSLGAEYTPHAKEYMIKEEEFKKRWLSSKKLYVFMTEKEYAGFKYHYPLNQGKILAHEHHYLVITNDLTQGDL